MLKNPYLFDTDTDKVYEWNNEKKEYQFIGHFQMFGIDESLPMCEKINKVVMFGVE